MTIFLAILESFGFRCTYACAESNPKVPIGPRRGNLQIFLSCSCFMLNQKILIITIIESILNMPVPSSGLFLTPDLFAVNGNISDATIAIAATDLATL